MFVLFDIVVLNPNHPEIDINLSTLNLATGYFSRLDYATGGLVPLSLLSGFVHIANQFVTERRSLHGTTRISNAARGNSWDKSVSSLPIGIERAGGVEFHGASYLSL